MGTFTWNKYAAGQTTNPGVIDIDHMQVNIGNDPKHPKDGTNATSTSWWDWVHVWQLPAAATASGNSVVTPQANFSGGTGACMKSCPFSGGGYPDGCSGSPVGTIPFPTLLSSSGYALTKRNISKTASIGIVTATANKMHSDSAPQRFWSRRSNAIRRRIQTGTTVEPTSTKNTNEVHQCARHASAPRMRALRSGT